MSPPSGNSGDKPSSDSKTIKEQLRDVARAKQMRLAAKHGLQWYGKITAVDGGLGGAIAAFDVDLTSEWFMGTRYNIKLMAWAVGVGVGGNLGGSISDIEFTTPKVLGSNMVAQLFEGPVSYVGASLVFGGGVSYGTMSIGAAKSEWSSSNAAGYTASGMALMGDTMGKPVITKESCSQVYNC